ncbi:Glycosyltransferase involved in cell wall bisynthesis [Flavobacterium resistens]|uniref:Glycosyltransferase n=1 Tax=Flavobacterium resistens TaxID=443612 RepID=A0A521ER95_9FLAO|nr:glycosyltransferase family A protein [Flavobacterium resistens]MRX67906.1 glycosyltransferase [Flavobacterium resistens]SMO86417.1 Glycosyltransferase involved in cell wall bisynthesis [Flavobacterium resistens]
MYNKVSVIVPCYNQAQYLDEALISVLNQTYSNWECIIVDDGSPDNTEDVASKWCDKDPRFKYLKKKNGGLCSARNAGIDIADGQLILPLDADDRIGNKYLELATKAFNDNNSLTVVYCKAEKFGDENGLWNLPEFSLFNLSRNNLIFCSAFFKKEDWKSVNGYDLAMQNGWEDWEFWIAILKNGGNVKCLNEVNFYYRIKKTSMLQSIGRENENENLNYLSIKHADFFVKQYGSFKAMEHQLIAVERENKENLKSEKFVIDVFCKRFFGFTIFGKYKE